MMNRRTVIATAAATAAVGTVAGALAGDDSELDRLIAELEQCREVAYEADEERFAANLEAHFQTEAPEAILLPGDAYQYRPRKGGHYWDVPGVGSRAVMHRHEIDACRDFVTERHALLDDYERRLARTLADFRYDELAAAAERELSRARAAHDAILRYRPANFAEAAHKLRWALEEHDPTDDPLFGDKEKRSPVAEMVVTALADIEALAGVDR